MVIKESILTFAGITDTQGIEDMAVTNDTFYVIPACRESFLNKDCGQAAMTKTALLMSIYL